MIAMVIDFFLKLIQHNKHVMIGWESKSSALLRTVKGEQILFMFLYVTMMLIKRFGRF